MITTLTGENSYLLGTRSKRLIDDFVSEYTEMGLERIDGEEAEYDRIREAVQSMPFLARKKLVVLRNPSANKIFLENYETLLSELSEITDILIIETKLDKRTAYAKFLQKKTDYTEFKEPDAASLAQWIREEVKSLGGNIDQSVARYLVNRVGINQQLLSNDLKKLVLYDPNVSEKTIELLVEPTPQSKIFDLIDAVFAGSMERATKLYKDQRDQKVEPQQILAMLAWQLHILAVIQAAGKRSANEIASAAKISPFVVEKSMGLARRIGRQKLLQIVDEALKIDIASKTTGLDLDAALHTFILEMQI